MCTGTQYPEFHFLNEVHDESESQKTRAEGKKPGGGECGLYDFMTLYRMQGIL